MSSRRPFRHDLTGLRSVAVILVVLFHADVPGLEAGFIGVDVFFALSGFLITRGLLDQIEDTGRIDLVGFWTARARRLLPAASLTIGVTLLLSLTVMSPFVWRERITEAWASTLYFANVHFGNQTQSYFGTSSGESPFLHFWSLSIEEQTYLALPLLITAVVWAMARGEQDRFGKREAVARLLWVLVACSLAFSVLALMLERTPMTYFNSVTRVWELGAGGLLALYTTSRVAPVVDRVGPTVVRVVGFALIAASLVIVDPYAVYPGAVALLPVLGTLLVISAVGGAVGPLESRPSIWVGERSYSWYLWHWPVIVLGHAAIERWTDVLITWPPTVGLAAVSLIPAAASYRWVEQPFRVSDRLRSSAINTVTGVGGVVLLSMLLLFGAAAVTSLRLAEPEMLALEDSQNDWPPLRSECYSVDAAVLLAECSTGPFDDPGSLRVLMVGDSHMANWVPAFTEAAVRDGGHTIAALAGSCSILDDPVTFDQWWCDEMRAGVWDAIDQLEPDVVIIGHMDGYVGALLNTDGSLIEADAQLAAWTDALTTFVDRLRAREISVIVVQPTPEQAADPIMCVPLHGIEECAGDRASLAATIAEVADAQRAALERIDGVAIFEPIDVLCPSEACVFVDNGRHVWSDHHHLTATYAASQADVVAPLLR